MKSRRYVIFAIFVIYLTFLLIFISAYWVSQYIGAPLYKSINHPDYHSLVVIIWLTIPISVLKLGSKPFNKNMVASFLLTLSSRIFLWNETILEYIVLHLNVQKRRWKYVLSCCVYHKQVTFMYERTLYTYIWTWNQCMYVLRQRQKNKKHFFNT